MTLTPEQAARAAEEVEKLRDMLSRIEADASQVHEADDIVYVSTALIVEARNLLNPD